ncbi:MAG: ferredoxin [Halanaerobiales bacterium]
MASVEDKYPDNVDGPYYVDEQCIACGVCPGTAPENFQMSDDGSYAYVYKQPENDEEKQAAEEAVETCPVDAIGNDG